jgi:hypothetical protein
VALPVSLTQFTGLRTADQSVLLRWITVAEQGNAFFTVQRSRDGNIFETIAVVEGFGNSNMQRNYTYTDANAPKEQVYYRLIQTDWNGKESPSAILLIPAVIEEGAAPPDIQIFPNPADAFIELRVKDYVHGRAQISICDAWGQPLRQTEWIPLKEDRIRISLEGLPASGYFMVIHSEQGIWVKRFVKHPNY